MSCGDAALCPGLICRCPFGAKKNCVETWDKQGGGEKNLSASLSSSAYQWSVILRTLVRISDFLDAINRFQRQTGLTARPTKTAGANRSGCLDSSTSIARPLFLNSQLALEARNVVQRDVEQFIVIEVLGEDLFGLLLLFFLSGLLLFFFDNGLVSFSLDAED